MAAPVVSLRVPLASAGGAAPAAPVTMSMTPDQFHSFHAELQAAQRLLSAAE